MTKKKAEEEQPPLFGNVDEIINVLETDYTDTQHEIEKLNNSIQNKRQDLDDMLAKQSQIRGALVSARKIAGIENPEVFDNLAEKEEPEEDVPDDAEAQVEPEGEGETISPEDIEGGLKK